MPITFSSRVLLPPMLSREENDKNTILRSSEEKWCAHLPLRGAVEQLLPQRGRSRRRQRDGVLLSQHLHEREDAVRLPLHARHLLEFRVSAALHRHMRGFSSRPTYLLLQAEESGSDRHGPEVPRPVHAAQVAARLPQSLVQSPLQLLPKEPASKSNPCRGH